VNGDQTSRTDLRKQTSDLLLTHHNGTVAEEKVNCAVNDGFRARFILGLDAFREARGFDAFLRLGADDRVVLATPVLRILFLPAPCMTFAMTTDAKCNQVVHHVATELAPRFHVVDLQVLRGTTFLTPPTISFEYARSDNCVFFRIQFESRSFLA
jgi:hypothetical protein